VSAHEDAVAALEQARAAIEAMQLEMEQALDRIAESRDVLDRACSLAMHDGMPMRISLGHGDYAWFRLVCSTFSVDDADLRIGNDGTILYIQIQTGGVEIMAQCSAPEVVVAFQGAPC